MTRMRHHGIGFIVLGLGIVLLAMWGYFSLGSWREHDRAFCMPVPTRFVRIPVREPSGVAYHPQRATLLVVSDAGEIVEMDLEYKVLRRFALSGDLEGIAVHPATGKVFIASERDGTILEYDLDEQRVLRTLEIDFQLHPDFAAGLRRNKGIEGVTVVTTGDQKYQLYAVVEAKPARLIALSADVSREATQRARSTVATDATVGVKASVRITASYDLGLPRLSDVMFHAQSGLLLVTSASARTLMLLSVEGHPLRSIRLPGKKPEGFCFMPNGDAVVADDTGGLWICQDLRPTLFPMRESKPEP